MLSTLPGIGLGGWSSMMAGLVTTTPRIPVERQIPVEPRLPIDDRQESELLRIVSTVVIQAAPPPTKGFWARNRTIVLFLLGLVATDWLIGNFAAVWSHHSPDDYAARVAGCQAQTRDLVFVGGSPVAEGIDPDQMTGMHWADRPLVQQYALGLSGATTSDIYHAVIRACKTPPRLLVYGITASDLNDSRNEPHGPYSLMGWCDVAEWVRLRPDSGEWVIRHFLQSRVGRASNLFRYRHGIRMWAATEADCLFSGSCPQTIEEARELSASADAVTSGSGYAPAQGYSIGRHDIAKAYGVQQTSLPYLHKYRTGSHVKYLNKLIDWCESNEVALVLVDMPVTSDLEALYPAAFGEYRDLLADIEMGRKVRIVRASSATVGLSDAHFADLIHLNREGARVLSGWLRNQLCVQSGSS